MMTAQKECFAERLSELKVLLPMHYRELALNQDHVPLDPQYDIYIARENLGELMFIVLREAGEMIGYFIGFVAPGLHYRTCLTLTMDILYVHPERRKAGGGVVLFDAVKAEAKRRGVQRAFVGEKVHAPIGKFLEAQGFELCERTYTAWLGK
jgi:GNAT superfamily N-acetyltransferase